MFKLPYYCSLNVLLPEFTIKSWVTCQGKFNMFLSWILKTYMTDVPQTSPERPIIWSPGRLATRSRRRPMDVLIYNFWIFVFRVKNSNSCVKQRLLHLKNTFFIKLSIFLGPPRVPWRSHDVSIFRGPSGDVSGMSHAGWEDHKLSIRMQKFVFLTLQKI